MKPFHELTDFEKAQLFDDDIEFYISLECAREGIELLPPKAPVPPDKSICDGDIRMWTVAGYHFREREQALAVQAAILSNNPEDDSYLPGSDYTRKTVGTYTPQALITEETWYSPQRWAAVRERVARYDADMNAYNEALAAYQRIQQARQGIAERITGEIDAAVSRIRKREGMESTIRQYLNLAQGSTETALEYLRKVYPRIEEDYAELLGELGFDVIPAPIREAA